MLPTLLFHLYLNHFTYINSEVPDAAIHRLVVDEHGGIVLSLEDSPSSVETRGALVEQHLPRFEVDGVQHSVVVLDLYRPGLVVVVVLVRDVHNRGDHVGVCL